MPNKCRPGDRITDQASQLAPLIRVLHRAATDSADREFLRFEGTSSTFADIHQRVEQMARGLAAYGIRDGDRVAIRLPNGPAWVISWLAVMRIGAVAVPTNCAYAVSDLDHILDDSGAAAIITDADGERIVQETPAHARGLGQVLHIDGDWAQTPDTPALIDIDDMGLGSLANLQYTSGTTGFPKACMLTHEYWAMLGQMVARHARVDSSDVMLTAQPFSYMDPLWNVATCLMARIPLVIMPRFSASRFWKTVREEKITLFYVLGTMPTLLYKQPEDPDDLNHNVRLVLCSGIPASLHRKLEQRWGAPWRETYGMTETGADLMVPLDKTSCVGSGSIGWPVDTKQVRVVDTDGNPVATGTPGELIVRGKPMMQGYWQQPEKTAEVFKNGWFHTGDLVTQSEDGSFKIVGRLKDMVRRSGENIAAAEVEHAANSHPEVMSSAVIGVPDELWGEEIKLFIQPRHTAVPSRELAESIGGHIRRQLARFKCPRYVAFVDEFPMTPSERISKPNIPDRFSTDSRSVFRLDHAAPKHNTSKG